MIADRLAMLAQAFRDDYPGRDLDPGVVQRVLAFCADKPEPQGIGASDTGAVCATWADGGETLSCQFSVDGHTSWAARRGGKYEWGSGMPSHDALAGMFEVAP